MDKYRFNQENNCSAASVLIPFNTKPREIEKIISRECTLIIIRIHMLTTPSINMISEVNTVNTESHFG